MHGSSVTADGTTGIAAPFPRRHRCPSTSGSTREVDIRAAEQQQALQSQNYRYQPRDAVVQQHYQAQRVQGASAPPQAKPQARQDRGYPQQAQQKPQKQQQQQQQQQHQSQQKQQKPQQGQQAPGPKGRAGQHKAGDPHRNRIPGTARKGEMTYGRGADVK